jgi:cytosine/adenosine deaminase-related metal-dependent hydrolase
MADRITLRCGAYTPFGFSDAAPERWALFEEAAQRAAFLGSLPEADDRARYPDRIGIEEHLRRVITLSRRLGKPVQIHLDQRNEPSEHGTETLLDVLDEQSPVDEPPQIWAIHMISPSTYAEDRWQRLLERLVAHKIGVISCPSAAIGMRQLRPVSSPTFNSFPRLLDLAAAGVPIRLGTDNMDDMCSPSTTPSLLDEVLVLTSALRFYDVEIIARFLTGTALG